MSDPTPITPPAPSAASVAAVDPKESWWQRRTTWAAILAILAGAPVVVNPILPILPAKDAASLGAVAAMLAALAGIFARQAGNASAAVVSERLDAHEERTGTG